jgi:hypothetical protein
MGKHRLRPGLVSKNRAVKEIKELKESSAQVIGSLIAKQMQYDEILTKLDMQMMAVSKMLREIFGHSAQANFLFDQIFTQTKTLRESLGESAHTAAVPVFPGITEETKPQITEAAEQWFKDCMTRAFQQVRAELDAYQKHQEMAKKEAEDKAEKERIEKELANADNSLQAQSQQPAENYIPPGAEVFGGSNA